VLDERCPATCVGGTTHFQSGWRIRTRVLIGPQDARRVFTSAPGAERGVHRAACARVSSSERESRARDGRCRHRPVPAGESSDRREIFAAAIAKGQTTEELSKALNPEALARFFAVTIQGMRAMARLKSDRRALRQVARVALAALDAR
jgi:hypothetical protein